MENANLGMPRLDGVEGYLEFRRHCEAWVAFVEGHNREMVACGSAALVLADLVRATQASLEKWPRSQDIFRGENLGTVAVRESKRLGLVPEKKD